MQVHGVVFKRWPFSQENIAGGSDCCGHVGHARVVANARIGELQNCGTAQRRCICDDGDMRLNGLGQGSLDLLSQGELTGPTQQNQTAMAFFNDASSQIGEVGGPPLFVKLAGADGEGIPRSKQMRQPRLHLRQKLARSLQPRGNGRCTKTVCNHERACFMKGGDRRTRIGLNVRTLTEKEAL